MACPRFPLKFLTYAEALGVGDDLVGDLLEEIASGRSQCWVWQQAIGLYGVALAAQLRSRARLTPHLVALALCGVLFLAASVASLGHVLELWLGVYYVSGMLSLFAHMLSRARAPQRE